MSGKACWQGCQVIMTLCLLSESREWWRLLFYSFSSSYSVQDNSPSHDTISLCEFSHFCLTTLFWRQLWSVSPRWHRRTMKTNPLTLNFQFLPCINGKIPTDWTIDDWVCHFRKMSLRCSVWIASALRIACLCNFSHQMISCGEWQNVISFTFTLVLVKRSIFGFWWDHWSPSVNKEPQILLRWKSTSLNWIF